MATTTPIDITNPESARGVGGELETTTRALATRLRDVSIADDRDLAQAVSDRQQIGEAIKRVVEYFAPLKGTAYKLWKTLCDRESEVRQPLETLDAAIADAMRGYKREQDRIRDERERAIADEQRRAQQADAAAEAAALEAQGDHELAAAVLDTAIAAPAPVVVLPDTTKAAGLKTRRRWCWKFAGGPADLKRTPPALVARTMAIIPREYTTIDDKKIGAYVRSMRESARIPGIDVYYVDDPIR